MVPEIKHIVLGEDGGSRALTGREPPSVDMINSVYKMVKTQGRGVYIARITGTPGRGGKIEQHGPAINNPKVSFAQAVENYNTRNRSGLNNPIFSNING